MEDQIITLSAQIVSAHVAANNVSASQLPTLIREVYQALSTAEHPTIELSKAEPKVAAKKSVFADHLVCLDCGKSYKMLKRHIWTDHQMTPAEYRTKWGLPASYPMVAADYAASRSKIATDTGLGQKPPPSKKGGRSRKG